MIVLNLNKMLYILRETTKQGLQSFLFLLFLLQHSLFYMFRRLDIIPKRIQNPNGYIFFIYSISYTLKSIFRSCICVKVNDPPISLLINGGIRLICATWRWMNEYGIVFGFVKPGVLYQPSLIVAVTNLSRTWEPR